MAIGQLKQQPDLLGGICKTAHALDTGMSGIAISRERTWKLARSSTSPSGRVAVFHLLAPTKIMVLDTLPANNSRRSDRHQSEY